MALIGNQYATLSNPGRSLGGQEATSLYAFARAHALKARQFGALASMPDGYGMDSIYAPPLTAGRIVARETANMAFSHVANGLMGLVLEGSTPITVTVADAEGGLITSGTGDAAITISLNSPMLTASLAATGDATFSVTTGTPTLGAEASLTGAADITFSGSLVSHAAGIMEGSTVDSGMTPDSVASAVWSALIADFQVSGTTGEALAGAGAAGNPWLADLGSYTGDQAGAIIKLIQRLLQNAQTTDPTTGTMTVFADDGVTPLLQADLFEDAAGTKPYEGKGAERRDRLE